MKLSKQLAIRYIRTKFKFLSALSKKKAAEKVFDLFCTPPSRHIKPLPKVFLQAEKLQFNLDKIIVKGWRWNHKATSTEKQPLRKVLILHGFESSATNFEAYIKLFIKKDYEVLAFDAPAHGRSGGNRINAPLYKRTIQEIIKKYGPVNSFMAHSFGGIALCLALEEMPQNKDCRVALIAPATESTTAVDNLFNLLKLDLPLRDQFEKIIIEKSGHPIKWYSINRAMKQIDAKILWLHDELDTITPFKDALVVKKQNFSNIEFKITKGLGHSRIYRDSQVVNQVVDFL